MSNHKFLTPFGFALLLLLVLAPVAQGQSQYEIQFLTSGESQSAVAHKEFPRTEIRFRILENGLSYNCKWLQNSAEQETDECKDKPAHGFQLFEDGREIPIMPGDYKFEPEPLDVTVVYQLDDIAHSNKGNNGMGNPLQSISEIYKYLNSEQSISKIQLRALCLTIVREGETPCKNVSSLDELNDKYILATDRDSGSFVDVDQNRIWQSIQDSHTGNGWHLVIWFLDDELHKRLLASGNNEFSSLLPADEALLAGLKVKNIELVIIDLMDDTKVQKDQTWVKVLGATQTLHYKTTGNPDNLAGVCAPWIVCLDENVVEKRKSSIHTITFNSTLFDDNANHGLRLQLIEYKLNNDPRQAPVTTLVGHARADFSIVPYYSQPTIVLRPLVRSFSAVFNLVTLVALFVVLILTEQPKEPM